MKYYLLSLGCQMNISDSERVKTVLSTMGFIETQEEENAELLGVMACSVRQKAIDKVYSLIHKWNTWKKNKQCITFISGCVLPNDREKFLKKFDLLFSINELPQLPDLIKNYGVPISFTEKSKSQSTWTKHNSDTQNSHSDNFKKNKNIIIPHTTKIEKKLYSPTTQNTPYSVTTEAHDLARGFWNVKPTYSSHFDAYITIQNGCDKFCTFCAVPYTRGREVSRSSSEILKEVYDLMKQGYKSITLLGQNVNSYGIDMNGKELTFSQLLERIGNLANELQHTCWIYFTSPHPRDMGKDVLEVIARYPCLAKQIHLPLQSGDDKLLFKMNRNHSISKYRQTVTDIHTIIPNATLFTDIIVGFCGETEEQFNNTKSAMQEFSYNMAYIAMYSPRPGAASYRWQDNVSLEVKKQRLHELSEILQTTADKKHKTYIGTTMQLLVENTGRTSETLQAKTEGKIPVMLTNTSSYDSKQLEGKFIQATITGKKSLSLLAETNGDPF